MIRPPKPPARPDRVSLWRYLRLFGKDILSAQPERLYRAHMAEFRTPFFRSFLINEPELIAEVLSTRPADFPKSGRIAAGLEPLLGRHSVFLTNGAEWQAQRRIIDPAFEGGRLHDSFPAMRAAVDTAVKRLTAGAQDIEPWASRLTADIIFRSLFRVPIEDRIASEVFDAFRAYQSAAPILNLAALLPGAPRLHRPATRRAARRIRALIGQMVNKRAAEIARGDAPDDLATRLMTARDSETGRSWDAAEMIDQVAIFFLAGHETSAAALGWALYLLAADPHAQARASDEARQGPAPQSVGDLARLGYLRDVFREALRLYPPVPMMVRSARCPERFRDRDVPQGAQIVISPWHLHRHQRHWDDPDAFCPERFQTEAGRASRRRAYLPFSAGPRVCPGAGFAMAEGVLALAGVLRDFDLAPVDGRAPVPRAHLTVRSANGIWLTLSPR